MNSGYLRQLAAGLALFTAVNTGFAADDFEDDNSPLRAKTLCVKDISPLRAKSLCLDDSQDRSFHVPGDADWARIPGRPDLSGQNVEVAVTSIDLPAPPGFRPRLEIFSADILENPSISPMHIFGDCLQPEVTGSYGRNNSMVFVRISNCTDAAALPYRLTTAGNTPIGGRDGGGLIVGTVKELTTGEPVSVFLRSSTNVFSFSDPGTGEYSLLVSKNTPVELFVLSETFDADPVAVPGIPAFQQFTRDILVKGDAVFRSGFELEPWRPDAFRSSVASFCLLSGSASDSCKNN